MRILLVDDDTMVGELTREVLAITGHEVHYVPTAEQALTELSRNAYEAVISDLDLGRGPNGLSVLMAARRVSVPCCILTSGRIEFLGHESVSGFRFVAKPFTCAELLGALEQTRQASILPSPIPTPPPPSVEPPSSSPHSR